MQMDRIKTKSNNLNYIKNWKRKLEKGNQNKAFAQKYNDLE